jgi:hypothetical protein
VRIRFIRATTRNRCAKCDGLIAIVRSNTSDDRFFMVAPGLEFPIGEAPANPATTLIKPDPTLDVAARLGWTLH